MYTDKFSGVSSLFLICIRDVCRRQDTADGHTAVVRIAETFIKRIFLKKRAGDFIIIIIIHHTTSSCVRMHFRRTKKNMKVLVIFNSNQKWRPGRTGSGARGVPHADYNVMEVVIQHCELGGVGYFSIYIQISSHLNIRLWMCNASSYTARVLQFGY